MQNFRSWLTNRAHAPQLWLGKNGYTLSTTLNLRHAAAALKRNTRSPTRINMQQTVKEEEEETKLSINMTVSGFEWVYNAGSSWAPLDQYTQHTIERLWSCNGASWVSSPSFGGQQIYIDTSEMSLVISGYSYTIARRQPRRQQQTRKRRM